MSPTTFLLFTSRHHLPISLTCTSIYSFRPNQTTPLYPLKYEWLIKQLTLKWGYINHTSSTQWNQRTVHTLLIINTKRGLNSFILMHFPDFNPIKSLIVISVYKVDQLCRLPCNACIRFTCKLPKSGMYLNEFSLLSISLSYRLIYWECHFFLLIKWLHPEWLVLLY